MIRVLINQGLIKLENEKNLGLNGVNGNGHRTEEPRTAEIVSSPSLETENNLESSTRHALPTQISDASKPARGGYRPGAGRKSKKAEDDLKGLIDSVWKLKDKKQSLKMMVERANRGDIEAFKMLSFYRYGKPAGEVKHTGQLDHVHQTPEQWQEERRRRLAEAAQAVEDIGDE